MNIFNFKKLPTFRRVALLHVKQIGNKEEQTHRHWKTVICPKKHVKKYNVGERHQQTENDDDDCITTGFSSGAPVLITLMHSECQWNN